ncbi:MAG: ATP citrate lyase citrate-binding domain-containing protein [Candidatus Latescibacter sp.]|nr:ATP citrate lyase citrate-binding domain-containing protein [Candidatus Latescibacter sp.]
MRLYEYEGKILFKKAGIRVPKGHVLDKDAAPSVPVHGPWPQVVKAQVLKGGRGKAGAVVFAENEKELREAVHSLLGATVFNEEVTRVIVEEKIAIEREYYISVTYKGDLPAVIFSQQGGMDVEELSRKEPSAVIMEPVDIHTGLESRQAHKMLVRAGVKGDVEELTDVMLKLYKCFVSNDALLAEINPLVLSAEGQLIAVDSKMELDDEALYRQTTLTLPERRDFSRKTTPLEIQALKNDQTDTRGAAGRMFYEIPGGDIIVLASGGGTSSEALDSLYMHGGRPAVFTEYSGNPTAEKVKGLTRVALSYPGEIHGIWVVGGRANFTDIYETLVNGIMAGIRETEGFDKKIPIVIRRAGLRDMEAFNALRLIRRNEKFNIFLRGMETSIHDAAQLLIHHVNNYKKTR